MWLAERSKPSAQAADAELGVTTIAGENTGVMVRGEVRGLPVFAPGGCIWVPENGDTVLVLKGGPGGEEQCIAGKKQEPAPAGLLPGEVYLHAGGASVWLRKDGSICLAGNVSVVGTLTVNGIAVPAPVAEG